MRETKNQHKSIQLWTLLAWAASDWLALNNQIFGERMQINESISTC